LTSLVEGVKTILLVALVERVVDNGASSTSSQLLEGSEGSTTSASNEGNDTNNNTSDDTSSKGDGGNYDLLIHEASLLLHHALRLRLDTRDSVAVKRGHSVVAAQGLVIAALEGNADSDSAEETVVGARDCLSNATVKSATVIHARILEVASNVIGSVRAVASRGVALVIGTTNAVVALVFSSIASTSLVIANGGDAEIGRGAENRVVHAGTIGAGVNGAGIAVVAILGCALATKNRIAGRSEARIRGGAIGVQSLAMVIRSGRASTEVGYTTIVITSAIDCA